MARSRRPLVVVEDHFPHVEQILELLLERAPELLPRTTVLCLDRPGPDTQAAVESWARSFPEVHVVADVPSTDPAGHQSLPAAALHKAPAFAKTVASLLAPRGVLLQDIQLQTLRFVPADQWWETIFLANTVRGMVADRAPRCIFMSNKRGFDATFGKELISVGFDPRDVLHKDELGDTLVPLLTRYLLEAFPRTLERSDRDLDQWLTADEDDELRVGDELDLVLWDHRSAKLGLGGRLVGAQGGRVELASDGHEAITWRALVGAYLRGEPGIPTHELGERVGPEGALRAEQGNAAARHVWTLRKRLRKHPRDSDALLTVDHHYRLADELRVGWVRRRSRSPGFRGNASEA